MDIEKKLEQLEKRIEALEIALAKKSDIRHDHGYLPSPIIRAVGKPYSEETKTW